MKRILYEDDNLNIQNPDRIDKIIQNCLDQDRFTRLSTDLGEFLRNKGIRVNDALLIKIMRQLISQKQGFPRSRAKYHENDFVGYSDTNLENNLYNGLEKISTMIKLFTSAVFTIIKKLNLKNRFSLAFLNDESYVGLNRAVFTLGNGLYNTIILYIEFQDAYYYIFDPTTLSDPLNNPIDIVISSLGMGLPYRKLLDISADPKELAQAIIEILK